MASKYGITLACWMSRSGYWPRYRVRRSASTTPRETMEPIRIAPLAEAALRIHHKKIAAKEIRLLKELPGDVIVESHAGAMLQVFSNLIGNAVEALPPKGTLQIRARCRPMEKHISSLPITGTGFRPKSGSGFTNRSSARKRSMGRGWGWRLPKRFLSGIAAESEAAQARSTGRSGTAFRVSLPLWAQSAAAAK